MLRFLNIKKILPYPKGSLSNQTYFLQKVFFSEKETVPEEEAEKAPEKVDEVKAEDTRRRPRREFDDFGGRPKSISKLPLKDADRVKYFKQEVDWYKAHPNSGPFDFLGETNSKDESMTRLRDKALKDFSFVKDIRNRIYRTLKDFQEAKENAQLPLLHQLSDLISLAFRSGIYDGISEKDFRYLIQNKSFLPFINVFFNSNFLQNSRCSISSFDLNKLLAEASKDPQYFPSLEFIKFFQSGENRQDNKNQLTPNFKAAKDFIEQNKNSNEYNYLNLIYVLFTSSKGSFIEQINFELFSENLVNLYWGRGHSPQKLETFKTQLYELLYPKLNIKDNTALNYMFADMFLTAPSFNEGLEIVALTLTILSRLVQEESNCNDLYFIFKQRFGEERFDLYIKRKLPSIFVVKKKKALAALLKKSIDNFFNADIKNENQVKHNIITFFDQRYYEVGASIYYVHSHNTSLDHDTYIGQSVKKIAAQESVSEPDEIKNALLSGNTEKILKMFQHEIESDISTKEVWNEILANHLVDPSKPFKLDDIQSAALLNDFLSAWEAKGKENFRRFQIDLNAPYRRQVDYKIIERKRKEREEAPVIAEAAEEPAAEAEAVPEVEEVKVEKTGARGFSTYIKKGRGLTFQPAKYFSSENNKKDENAELSYFENENSAEDKKDNFKNFLKQAQNVDQSVKDQQLSEEDLSKMKGVLFDEGKGVKKGDKVFIRGPGQRKDKNDQRQSKDDGFKFQKIGVEKSPFAESVELNKILLSQDFWSNIVGNRKGEKELAPVIEEYFFTSKDVLLAQNAIEDLIKNLPLSTFGIQESQTFIFKTFLQPELLKMEAKDYEAHNLKVAPGAVKLEADPKLEATIDTNYGKVTKDFNKYLKGTVLPYSIGDQNYRAIFTLLKTNYKRLFFKRAVAHLARFTTDISKETLTVIAEICYEQKIGLTLIEITQVLIQNKIINNETQFRIVIDQLKLFKDLADNCEYLARSFCEANNIQYSVKLIQPHIELLMKHNKQEHFMPIFDRTKDYLNSRKLKYDENLSPEENVRRTDEFKLNQKNVITAFYRDFVGLLNTYEINSFAKLLYKEQNELKLISTVEDTVNGIYAYKNFPDELKKFLNKMKDETDDDNVTKLGNAFLDILLESAEQNSKFVEEIVEHIILKGRMKFNPDNINNIITVIMKAKLYADFSRFLTYLIKNPVPTKKNTKILCYRLLNQSKDEISKPQLMGLVDEYFSDRTKPQEQQTRQKDKKSKRSQSEPVKEAPKEDVAEKEAPKEAQEGQVKTKEGKKGKEAKEAKEAKDAKETKEEATPQASEPSDEVVYKKIKTKNEADKIIQKVHKRKIRRHSVNLHKSDFLSKTLTQGPSEST